MPGEQETTDITQVHHMPSVLPLPAELAALDMLDKIVQCVSSRNCLNNTSRVHLFGVGVEGGQASLPNAICGPVGGSDPASAPTAGGSQATVMASPAKRVKFSSVIDQLDETETNTMSQKELDQAYANHIEIKGAEPPSEAEPTSDQIAALKQRVVDRIFSVLTPFGRRLQKQMKARSWVLQSDGTFKGLDIPGPPSFDAWAARWKVYRSALFVLRYPPDAPGQNPKQVVTAAALKEYSDRISKLIAEFPETWHLVMQSEDRCRGEMFERYRRQAATGRLPMAIDFDGATPLDWCIHLCGQGHRLLERACSPPCAELYRKGREVHVPAKGRGCQCAERIQAGFGKRCCIKSCCAPASPCATRTWAIPRCKTEAEPKGEDGSD